MFFLIWTKRLEFETVDCLWVSRILLMRFLFGRVKQRRKKDSYNICESHVVLVFVTAPIWFLVILCDTWILKFATTKECSMEGANCQQLIGFVSLVGAKDLVRVSQSNKRLFQLFFTLCVYNFCSPDIIHESESLKNGSLLLLGFVTSDRWNPDSPNLHHPNRVWFSLTRQLLGPRRPPSFTIIACLRSIVFCGHSEFLPETMGAFGCEKCQGFFLFSCFPPPLLYPHRPGSNAMHFLECSADSLQRGWK